MHYLVGTPQKVWLNRREPALQPQRPWLEVLGPLRVKCVPEDCGVYALTLEPARVDKERSPRPRASKKTGNASGDSCALKGPTRDELLLKLGKAAGEAGSCCVG